MDGGGRFWVSGYDLCGPFQNMNIWVAYLTFSLFRFADFLKTLFSNNSQVFFVANPERNSIRASKDFNLDSKWNLSSRRLTKDLANILQIYSNDDFIAIIWQMLCYYSNKWITMKEILTLLGQKTRLIAYWYSRMNIMSSWFEENMNQPHLEQTNKSMTKTKLLEENWNNPMEE